MNMNADTGSDATKSQPDPLVAVQGQLTEIGKALNIENLTIENLSQKLSGVISGLNASFRGTKEAQRARDAALEEIREAKPFLDRFKSDPEFRGKIMETMGVKDDTNPATAAVRELLEPLKQDINDFKSRFTTSDFNTAVANVQQKYGFEIDPLERAKLENDYQTSGSNDPTSFVLAHSADLIAKAARVSAQEEEGQRRGRGSFDVGTEGGVGSDGHPRFAREDLKNKDAMNRKQKEILDSFVANDDGGSLWDGG